MRERSELELRVDERDHGRRVAQDLVGLGDATRGDDEGEGHRVVLEVEGVLDARPQEALVVRVRSIEEVLLVRLVEELVAARSQSAPRSARTTR